MGGTMKLLPLTWLSLLLAGCSGGGGSGGLHDYDCSVFPPSQTSPYILPWNIGQSFVAYPHAARQTGVQRYAIDFLMPIGTQIIAIRAGVVVRVQESFVDGDNVLFHENYVLIEHDDGTVARYIHLTNLGVVPAVGDLVRQGDIIGYSGHTGNSTAPHLHLDVTKSCCAVAPDYNELPFGETIPLNFRNASPSSTGQTADPLSCGLRYGISYTASL
jgi:murein DD-endopeptidase MepM/ murein hydrolase activator NlpD